MTHNSEPTRHSIYDSGIGHDLTLVARASVRGDFMLECMDDRIALAIPVTRTELREIANKLLSIASASERAPTQEELAIQRRNCACRGSDDYCPCGNVLVPHLLSKGNG